MKAAQFARAGGPLEVVTRDIPQPGPGHVRLSVHACGICHGDMVTKHGHIPGITYPVIAGHEVTGVIDALGPGVTGWRVGQRVGVGWFGAGDGTCDRCRKGDFITCRRAVVTGVHCDGGYAEYMNAATIALARVPDELDLVETAPLLCAGTTTFNALRHSGAMAGDVVGILGLGGLGHLGVQFAAAMGFETVAIARGRDKEPFARQLGARHYIDSSSQDVAKALGDFGGAKVILATVSNAGAMSAAINGLGVDGVLMVAGAPAESLNISAVQLIVGRKALKGWMSGTSADSEDALRFAATHGIRPIVEPFELARAVEGFERMASGQARFRVVLTTGAQS